MPIKDFRAWFVRSVWARHNGSRPVQAALREALGELDRLPLRDGSVRVAVSQEVFEHLPDPWTALAEVARTLEPGGLLYLQIPFVIGYHAAPQDYWRFTADGLEHMLRSAGLRIERLETAVGAGTGTYRIAVEYFAVLASALWSRAYLPVKALAAVGCWPLRWTDAWAERSPERTRIPGGFLALARKPA